MRISSKGRYALAALTEMALSEPERQTTVSSLAKKLDISHVYLEQIFSLLRRSKLVVSSKGAHGGSSLSAAPETITVLDILAPIELALFGACEETVAKSHPDLETAMRELVLEPLDAAVRQTLQAVSLADLAAEVRRQQEQDDGHMYYI